MGHQWCHQQRLGREGPDRTRSVVPMTGMSRIECFRGARGAPFTRRSDAISIAPVVLRWWTSSQAAAARGGASKVITHVPLTRSWEASCSSLRSHREHLAETPPDLLISHGVHPTP